MNPDVRWRVARGVRSVWRSIVGLIDGASMHELDGVLITLTNIRDPELNSSFVTRDPLDPAGALAGAEEIFRGHGHPFGIDMDEGAHPEVEAAADSLGFRPLLSRPGMALDAADLDEVPCPPGVEIRPVPDRADLAAFVDVQVGSFEMDRDVATAFMPAAITHPDVEYYLASLEDAPISAAAAYVADGAVGVFGVGTVPSARNRGVGTAITARAIADARGRANLAFLQASEEGLTVYERLGFRRVSDWVVWTRPS